jgi:hypothetical protein
MPGGHSKGLARRILLYGRRVRQAKLAGGLAGSSGAPVLNILRAHVRLTDVEEHIEPYTVTRKSDSRTFTLDPAFNCTVEIIDDGQDDADNGVTFFEAFKYKNTEKDKTGEWINQENSKLGALTEVVKPGYFEDDSIPELDAEDLEGFEMLCRIKPKKNPSTGAVTGSTIDWETMQPLPKETAAAVAAEEDEDFSDIPL